jgi:hypothetical protein
MTFGGQARKSAAGGGARNGRFLGFIAALIASLFLLVAAGCGGGSSSSSPGNNGGNPSGGADDAFVRGTVVDSANGLPLPGAVVQYGSVTPVTTGADGAFNIRVASRIGTQTLKVTGSGSLSLYDYGTVGSQAYRIRSQGAPIPALEAAQNYNVGNVSVFTSSSAPPPPIFP